MEPSTIALIGLFVSVTVALSTALWRIRTEAQAADERLRTEHAAQVTAVNAKAHLAIEKVNELELEIAKHYVSKEHLAGAVDQILREFETGFGHLNERLDWLRNDFRGDGTARRAPPRARTEK